MFLIRTTLIISLGLVTTCALHAQVVRDEIHTLTSITAPENAFLSGTPSPNTVQIEDSLAQFVSVATTMDGTDGENPQVTAREG